MTDKNPKGHRERIRERFLSLCKSGKNKFSGNDTDDTFILELLLTYTIPRKDTRPIAEKLISEFGSLSGVLSASPEMLSKVKGIGDVSAVFLKLIDFLRIQYAKPGTDDVTETAEPQIPLFRADISEEKSPAPDIPKKEKIIIKKEKKQNQRSGLFSKAVLKESIDLLPDIPDTDSLEEVKQYFRDHLHYSAESPRNRYSNYTDT